MLRNDLENLMRSNSILQNELTVLKFGGYVEGDTLMDFYNVIYAIDEKIAELKERLSECTS